MKIEYIYSDGDTALFDGSGQRNSVIRCPYCRFKYEDEEITEQCTYWYNTPEKVIQIIMQHYRCHRDGIIILSRCIDCGNISWIHMSFAGALYQIGKYHVFNKDKIEDERQKRIKFATQEWENSKCKTCSCIKHTSAESPAYHKYGVWVDCEFDNHKGRRSGEPITECKNYKGL